MYTYSVSIVSGHEARPFVEDPLCRYSEEVSGTSVVGLVPVGPLQSPSLYESRVSTLAVRLGDRNTFLRSWKGWDPGVGPL